MKSNNRNICFLVFILWSIVNTSYGQITRVEINNELLYQPIDSFVRTISMKPTDLGVIKIYFESVNNDPYLIDEIAHTISDRPLDCEIVLELELNRDGLFLRPPSHYFVYKDRPILIYSGVEQLMKFKKSEIKKFVKKISYRLPPEGTISFPLPWMKFIIKGKNVQIIPAREDDK